MASNVVQFPRDWLGPREELVPFGPAADDEDQPPAPARGGAEARERDRASALTQDDFWGGAPDAIPKPVVAPPAPDTDSVTVLVNEPAGEEDANGPSAPAPCAGSAMEPNGAPARDRLDARMVVISASAAIDLRRSVRPLANRPVAVAAGVAAALLLGAWALGGALTGGSRTRARGARTASVIARPVTSLARPVRPRLARRPARARSRRPPVPHRPAPRRSGGAHRRTRPAASPSPSTYVSSASAAAGTGSASPVRSYTPSSPTYSPVSHSTSSPSASTARQAPSGGGGAGPTGQGAVVGPASCNC